MSPKVLIVERHTALRGAALDAFLACGAAVQSAPDVDTAHALLAAWQPDVVVVDMSAIAASEVDAMLATLRSAAPQAAFVLWAWGVPETTPPPVDAIVVRSTPDDVGALVDRAQAALHEIAARTMN